MVHLSNRDLAKITVRSSRFKRCPKHREHDVNVERWKLTADDAFALQQADAFRIVPERERDQDVHAYGITFKIRNRSESRALLPISTTPLIQCALPSSKENLTRRTEKNRHCKSKNDQHSDTATPNRMTTYDGLNRIEQQRQRFAQSPGDQNQQRHDEQRDLNAAPDRHRHGEIKLAFAGHDHGGGVLCSVGEDGQDYQRQELSRDRPILCGGQESVN